jgi:hypothetical protein
MGAWRHLPKMKERKSYSRLRIWKFRWLRCRLWRWKTQNYLRQLLLLQDYISKLLSAKICLAWSVVLMKLYYSEILVFYRWLRNFKIRWIWGQFWGEGGTCRHAACNFKGTVWLSSKAEGNLPLPLNLPSLKPPSVVHVFHNHSDWLPTGLRVW